jgi:hypothetical protein
VNYFLSSFAAISGSVALVTQRAVSLYCLKDGNLFCAPRVQAQGKLPKLTRANLNTAFTDMCSDRCFLKFATRYFTITVIANESVSAVKNATDNMKFLYGMCAKNGAEYCFAAYHAFDNRTVFTNAGCQLTPTNQTCPANCKTVVNETIMQSMGCCLGNMAALLQKIPRPDNLVFDESDPATFTPLVNLTNFLTLCGFSYPGTCPTKPAVTGNLTLPNLSWDYVKSHNAEVKDKTESSIAYTAGIPRDGVSVTLKEKTSSLSSRVMAVTEIGKTNPAVSTSAVFVEYTITPGDDSPSSDASAIVMDVNEQISNKTLEMPAMADLPADAKINPNAGAGDISVDNGASTLGGANTIVFAAMFVLMSFMF